MLAGHLAIYRAGGVIAGLVRIEAYGEPVQSRSMGSHGMQWWIQQPVYVEAVTPIVYEDDPDHFRPGFRFTVHVFHGLSYQTLTALAEA